MKHRSILIMAFGIALLSNFKAKAQGYITDAIRIAQPSIGGTTRTFSIGGAQNSLGGDIGNLSGNPAGLGFYRRSDFAITGILNNQDLEATYLGNKTLSNQQRDFNIVNAGIVFAQSSPQADRRKPTDNKIVSFAFGAGFNRTNNLNLTTNFSGTNFGRNFSNNLAELGTNNGTSSDPNDPNYSFSSNVAGIAYDEYLIDSSSTIANTFIGKSSGATGVLQSGTFQEKGYNDQSNFNVGMNFGNVVYLGAGVNFENYSYSRFTDFIETGLSDNTNHVDGLEYNKSTYQSGTGINGKLGIIFNLLNVIHIGGYVQTPTNYNISETVDFSLLGIKSGTPSLYVYPSISYIDNAGIVQSGSYDPIVSGYNEFSIKTPFKYNVGASLLLGNFGFLSADAEYLDYKELSFNSNNAAFDQSINDGIKSKYKAVLNYRAGAELKFGPLVFRGGYAYYPSYLEDVSVSTDQSSISGGFGIHLSKFYIDFGGVQNYSTNYRQQYTFGDGTGPVVKSYNVKSSGTITIGTRF